MFRLFCRFAFAALIVLSATDIRADIVVTTGNDVDNTNPTCSLREAIIAVNTQADYHGCNDPGTTWSKITFAIGPNAGEAYTIAVGSDLPAITKPVFIDATTQNGTTCTPVPNLKVRVSNGASASVGMHLGAGSAGSRIRGLAFSGLSNGIWIDSDLATIGCVIAGMDATGTTVQPNTIGVYISAKFATIGEATATAWFPNLISGNDVANIDIAGGDDALIAGNYIGTDRTGLAPLPTGYGIQIAGAARTHIGTGFTDGPVSRQRNIIGVSSNGPSSVQIDLGGATDTIISGNYIGVGVDGQTVLPIVIGTGININASTDTLIGCNGYGSWDDCRNVIVSPTYDPISIANSTTGTAIVSNFINIAANGVTSLAGGNSQGLTLANDALVARNVIGASTGVGINLFPPNDHSPTAVFLNGVPAGNGGITLNSRANCLPDTTSIGVNVTIYGTATATPTTFIYNWWGAANGPGPAGSGAQADAAVTATPFLAAPSIYCGFDRIFTDGFDS